jgi:hypothetical protein
MVSYRGRKAIQLESGAVRLTVLVEGGHIAEILHKRSGVNPLWTPQWSSVEPSAWSLAGRPEYGSGAEAKLLAGIMGHNLCLGLFGGPSEEEAAAGMTAHGESSVAVYDAGDQDGALTMKASFPEAQLRFERTLRFETATVIRISEQVENLKAWDAPIAWTQHVTLGAPFVAPGLTQFRASATRSEVFEGDFAAGKGYMEPGAEFEWPHVPRAGGGTVDMRTFIDLPVSGAYSAHLMDPGRENAFFMAWSPTSKVLIGYVWRRADFPWLGIWEENRGRTFPPWNGREITRGMEFGVSPMPETRREMIARGSLFGVPAFRWIPARKTVTVEYRAFITQADSIPEEPPRDILASGAAK